MFTSALELVKSPPPGAVLRGSGVPLVGLVKGTSLLEEASSESVVIRYFEITEDLQSEHDLSSAGHCFDDAVSLREDVV